MTLRTAVIGAGIVAENNHFPALTRNPKTTLTAVCDLDESRAREAAAEHGATAYADPETLFAEEDLDWVHVATPVQSHAELATTAIESGIPVTLQKPATTTRDELEGVLASADEHDVPTSVVHNWLFYPVVRRLRRRIRTGELGEIRAVETTFTGEGRPDETYRGSWVFDLPGGDLEEGFPHPLYLTLAIGGTPRDEEAIDVRTRVAGEYDDDVGYDGVKIQYVTDDDALCSVTYTSGSAPNNQIRVHGTERSVTVDVPTNTVDAHDRDEGPYHFLSEQVRRGVTTAGSSLSGVANSLAEYGLSHVEDEYGVHRERSADGHYFLFNEAATALERGRQPPVPLSRSRWVLTLMERAREA
ncbi:Gfo/Idh/MocA family protein [Haladaptatus salinisoli]|uniref:Gfo/Idh/MocA family protein n=1 Tax=Haladaptatus salinisoli TaxID=2884876 RepID=UPI001D0B6AA0|nr:Gfo/Idh/MocA family oxidoreductase [Haladaptatus salinisoli]